MIIDLNKKHKIYQGHFPSVPIVPGVCSIQIIKEVVQKILSLKLILIKANSIKFLSLINPNEISELLIKIILSEDSGIYTADTTFNVGEKTLLKFKGMFKSELNSPI